MCDRSVGVSPLNCVPAADLSQGCCSPHHEREAKGNRAPQRALSFVERDAEAVPPGGALKEGFVTPTPNRPCLTFGHGTLVKATRARERLPKLGAQLRFGGVRGQVQLVEARRGRRQPPGLGAVDTCQREARLGAVLAHERREARGGRARRARDKVE